MQNAVVATASVIGANSAVGAATGLVPPTGVEGKQPEVEHSPVEKPDFTMTPGEHYRLIQAVLRDQTDGHSELLAENEWLLHPNEVDLKLQGNAFAVENVRNGAGRIYIKLAPLPAERPESVAWDLRIPRGTAVFLNRADGYTWAIAPYEHGKWGRIAATHRLQREARPYKPDRDGLLLSNTWGDRNRDARINAQFMQGEVDAGARLGVDVVQIDDGWQKGITSNSASAAHGSGIFNGFWASDPEFWTVNAARFPDGLAPLIASARSKGIQFGLWFAPDSSSDFQNWRRDADVIIGLHRDLGVSYFKIDGVNIRTRLGETNLTAFLDAVLDQTQNSVTFDLDITAGNRLGPFGHIAAGPLFVENRYTDWHNYWPHQTLRVAWQLAHWIDPARLRLEWLNNTRSLDKYPNDALAPSLWAPDALLATVMFMSPLGWFEIQSLPESYFESAAPLVRTWKSHRVAIQEGDLLPIGDTPDGVAWTGFVSINGERNGGYALLFRELNPAAAYALPLPLLTRQSGDCQVLGGAGSAHWTDGHLHVDIPATLGFLWVQLR